MSFFDDYLEFKSEDFTEKEKELLNEYIQPLLRKLSNDDKSLNHMYAISKPDIQDFHKVHSKELSLLKDKKLIVEINDSLFSKAYIYYELLISKQIKYTKYLCEFLKYLNKNEEHWHLQNLFECDLFSQYATQLTETELMFIFFLLDNMKLIELHYYGSNPPSNYWVIKRERALIFNRVTFKGKRFLKQNCYIRNFDYIKDLKIRQEISRRYLTIQRLKKESMFLLAQIVIGSILEQILRSYYNSDEHFIDLINKAYTDKLISKNEKEILHILRSLRNFIHIHLFIKSEEKITEKKFLGIYQFFEDFLDRFEIYFTGRKLKN